VVNNFNVVDRELNLAQVFWVCGLQRGLCHGCSPLVWVLALVSVRRGWSQTIPYIIPYRISSVLDEWS
jgi:hypothetical protein